MSPRSIRRAAERKARKEARKAERLLQVQAAPAPPSALPPNGFVPQNASPTTPRAEINRANALHSTGPRSPEGKCASSRNSLKHGLASGTLIIPGEDQTAFDALLNDLLAEHQPANTTEELLIQEMAQSFWLTQRALRLQNDCFTENGVDQKRLSLFLRYQTTHDRAFHKALNTLLKMQKDRRRGQIGFVSQTDTAPPPDSGFVSQNGPSRSSEPRFVRQNSPLPRSAEAA